MSSPAALDIRLPIGALFAFDGAVLTVYGALTTPPESVARYAGNVTAWWGAVIFVFGASMLGFALKSRRRSPS